MYKSALTGQYVMPWVRLHGCKDYLDLVLLLERFPKLHQTVNLVPSLIVQIEEAALGKAIDPWLESLASEVLTIEQRLFALERCFDANWDRMIRPWPRYNELLEQRQTKGIPWCLHHWQEGDFNDLITWYTLCWFDPIFQTEDPEIRDWFSKGRDFSYADRLGIIAKQQEIVGQIIPKHRELQDKGQLEITTTPFTHPILPLLVDSESALVANPQLRLPDHLFHWPIDVEVHLDRAQKLYKDIFNRPARGLWPSEQSVSPQILAPVLNQGFQWMISDEEVLARTLKIDWKRDPYGHIQQADALYQPYQVTTPQGDIAMVFRDHRMSDLIGFKYSKMAPTQAAGDFIEQLEAIQRRLTDQGVADKPHLVTVALDGENCWEFYEKDGLPFLEALYQRFSDHEFLKLVTVSEYLAEHPARRSFPGEQLHSGSWINSDFGIWIGDPIKNKAWSLLADARQAIDQHPAPPQAAYEALWCAEGSDWFWWYGHPHSSHHDYLFDQLFREHLQGIYQALLQTPPPALFQPLDPPKPKTPPIISPQITGYGTDQGWDNAISLDPGGSHGTMYEQGPIRRIRYGVNNTHLYIRVDWHKRPEWVDFFFYAPGKTSFTSLLPYADCPQQAPYTYRFGHQITVYHGLMLGLFSAGEYDQWFSQQVHTRHFMIECLELAIPWSDLNLCPGEEVCWVALASIGGGQTLPLLAHTVDIQIPY